MKEIVLILPEEVKSILNKLEENDYEGYIVGGCVRDCLLGLTPKDWDMTTSAKPVDVKSIFSHTVDTGIKHGTVTVIINKMNFEVTTYRVESDYEDYRRPSSVNFTTCLEEDLLRRDFTMNAIAYHPIRGYKDPFFGIADINKKIIKGVGNPELRFKEDALRMLRALRFSIQLGFVIENETYNALKENVELIKKISVERIREELEKLLNGKYFEYIPLLWESGLISQISDKLAKPLENNRENIIKELKNASEDRIIRWVIFLQSMTDAEGKKFLKNLKMDTLTLISVTGLLKNLYIELLPTHYNIRKKAYEMGSCQLKRLIDIKKLQNPCEHWLECERIFYEVLENEDCITLKDMKITGNDLMEMGVAKGKLIGEILMYLLDLVHQNPSCNEHRRLKEAATREFLK